MSRNDGVGRDSGGVVADAALMSEAMAGPLANGGIGNLGQAAGGGLATEIIERVRDACPAGRDQAITNYRQPGQ